MIQYLFHSEYDILDNGIKCGLKFIQNTYERNIALVVPWSLVTYKVYILVETGKTR